MSSLPDTMMLCNICETPKPLLVNYCDKYGRVDFCCNECYEPVMKNAFEETNIHVMNDVYAELGTWNTSKLFPIFSRDDGAHILPTRIYDFIVPFLRGHVMEHRWNANHFSEYKQEWVDMLRTIKKMAIEREARCVYRMS